MTAAAGPNSINNGLLLNLDFANPKSYQPRENLFVYSENQVLAGVTNQANNTFFINTNTTLTPIGTTASTLIINASTSSQYNYIAETYNTSQTGFYTFSFYAKPYNASLISMIFGTNSFGVTTSSSVYNIVYINPSTTAMTSRSFTNSSTNVNTVADFTWGSVPADNGWTRYWMTANLTTTTGVLSSMLGGFYIGDPGSTGLAFNTGVYTWGWQLESSNTANTYISTTASVVLKNTTARDMVGGNTFAITGTQYISNNSAGYVQFNRFPATTSTQKAGGNMIVVAPTGRLSVSNFLYYDHTWEIWARLDDINPVSIAGDGTEGSSCLALYNGFHQGFFYNASQMTYLIWSSGTSVTPVTWTVGLSGAQINQGSWYQIAVTRSGNVFTPYINGQQLGTGSTTAVATNNVVSSNNINLGSAYPAPFGTNSFLFYSKNSISLMRMYNRALTAGEIQQNFATRRTIHRI